MAAILAAALFLGLPAIPLRPAGAGQAAFRSNIVTAAKCDDATDDTLAIQRAVDSVPSSGGSVVFPVSGTCVTRNIVIADKSSFSLSSLGASVRISGATSSPGQYIGFELRGHVSNFTAEHLTIVGDGVPSHGHAGFWVAANATLDRPKFLRNNISRTTLGIAISSPVASRVNGALIADNELTDIVGEDPGHGYAIQAGSGDGSPSDAQILHNFITGAQRHSIYVSNGGGALVDGNVIRWHRRGAADPASQRSAIVVCRSTDVIVSGNFVDRPKDGAIEVCPGAHGALPARNILVRGNMVTNPTGRFAALLIGSLTPAADEDTDGIVVDGNSFFQDGGNTPQAVIYTGKRITYVNNQHYMLRVTGPTSAVQIRGLGEEDGTARYSDDLDFRQNIMYVTQDAGGRGSAVDFHAAAARSSIGASFVGNRMITSSPALSFGAPQTNHRVSIDSRQATAANQSQSSEAADPAASETVAPKPACDVTRRGMMWVVRGSVGQKDTVEMCLKDAAETFAWRTVY